MNQNTFTFKKLESENLDFILKRTQTNSKMVGNESINRLFDAGWGSLE